MLFPDTYFQNQKHHRKSKTGSLIHRRGSEEEELDDDVIQAQLLPSLFVLPAVGGGAPATVRLGDQPPPQHELLVLLHEGLVPQDQLDVVGVEALRALRAADVDPRLGDFDAQVLSQAVRAGAMVAGHDVREVFAHVAQQAQRALQQLARRPRRRGGRRRARSGLGGRFVVERLRLDALDADDSVHDGAGLQGPQSALIQAAAPTEEGMDGQAAPLGGLPD